MNRENGKDMNLPSFFDFKSEAREVRHKLRIPSAASVVGVFTSTEFEQAYNEDFKSITEQMTLIDQLIEMFRDRSEYLVIRHHPYIAGSGVSPPDLTLLTRIHEQAATIPPNVRVIMPSERLSSYALFPILAAAIAPYSTVSLEGCRHSSN